MEEGESAGELAVGLPAVRGHTGRGPSTPRDAGADLVDHPVDDLVVRHPGPSRRGPRYQRSEQLPLLISEFMTTYHDTMIYQPDDL